MEHPEHLLHPNVERHWAKEQGARRDAAAQAPDAASARGKWLPMFAIAPAMMISALDMTTLNVALPDLTSDLNATTSDLQWILASYTIVLAGFLLFAQGIGDRFGRKGTFMAGLTIFMCASATAAFTNTPPPLIMSRTAMGIGAALMMSPTLAMIAVIYEPKERPKAIAIWVAFGSIGMSLGPIVGGFLVDAFGWQATFLINVPVIMLTLIATAKFLPTSRKPGDVHLDFVGMVLSVVGLSVLLYGVIEGPEKHWLSAPTLSAIGIGLLICAGFIIWELRSAAPMFDPRVFKVGRVQAGAGTLFAVYFTFLGMLFLIPQYLQFVLGHSAAVVGIILFPFGVVIAIASQCAASLCRTFGRERVVISGMLLVAVGFVALEFVRTSDVPVLVGIFFIGAGYGLTIGPGTTLVVDALPVSKAGDGSSVNMLVRQVGGACGVAIIGSVFATAYAGRIVPSLGALDASDATDAARSIQGADEAAAKLAGAAARTLTQAADDAFVAAARSGLITALVLALASAGLTFIINRRHEPPVVVEEADGDVLVEGGAA